MLRAGFSERGGASLGVRSGDILPLLSQSSSSRSVGGAFNLKSAGQVKTTAGRRGQARRLVLNSERRLGASPGEQPQPLFSSSLLFFIHSSILRSPLKASNWVPLIYFSVMLAWPSLC